MGKIGARTGDIIAVSGKRTTPLKAMPAFQEERGRAVIQLDGLARYNAGVETGEPVEVSLACTSSAGKVHVKLLSGNLPTENTAQILSYLEGFPTTAGDRFRVVFPTARWADFEVLEISPDGIVVFSPDTVLALEKNSMKTAPGRVTYKDIGGFGTEIRKIREMVELPLRHPEIFQKLGIDPPQGVLLHGPPGCGKTLTARAVAGETEAYFISVNGPEIMRKFYGESEAYLREVFEKAEKNAPAIVFIDELDAIAPRRTETRGDVEKRVVAQLLALLDGLKSRGSVVVIGATNIPDALDPALRRPGRFDREISIGVPSRAGRKEILDIHTREMPLASDVDLEKIAAITHGFVGADLAALCREAAMYALRRCLPQIDYTSELPADLLLNLKVKMQDFVEALGEVEPSALRETYVEVPQVDWDDVGGLDEVKQILLESIEWPIEHGELYSRLGVRPPKGILLCGPPGTGKTLLAKAAATRCGANFISVKGPELMSKYVGESEEAVREVFRKARQASPCIIFFDEIDALLPRRGLVDNTGVTDRVVSQFLTELDGIEELKGVIVLAATNRPDILDPAVLRPGRFDLTINLPLPEEEGRKQIFRIHLRHKEIRGDVNLEHLAKESEGLSGAEIEAVCQSAALRAMRRYIRSQKEGKETSPLLAGADFEEGIKEVKSRKGVEKYLEQP
jgi:transitional endoplasmic reticulum ATPase